jgi:hypothetical protein
VLDSGRITRFQAAIPSSPTGALRVVVYPVGSSQSTYGSEERRGAVRHRTPSLMYVQLGPENGGIVVNLGRNGLAFQAAMKLNVEKNSVLNVRLRGSGLNAELAGEIAWLGATQKDAGICFKSVSPSVGREIADWVERQTQGREAAAPADGPRSKAMSAMAGIGATRDLHAQRKLSAALAMSRAVPAGPQRSSDADSSKSSSPAPVKSPATVSGPAPLPEIVSPVEHANTPPVDSPGHAQDHAGVSVASPKPTQVVQQLQDQQPLELTTIERLRKLLARPSASIVHPAASIQRMTEKPPQASAEAIRKNEFSKAEEIGMSNPDKNPSSEVSCGASLAEGASEPGNCPPEVTAEDLSNSNIPSPSDVEITSAKDLCSMETEEKIDSPANNIPRNEGSEEFCANMVDGRDMSQAPVLPQTLNAADQVSIPQSTVPQSTVPRVAVPKIRWPGQNVSEKWIPPVLLAAWRQGNRHRRIMLGGTAGVCLLIFGAILALAVAGINRQGRPAQKASTQQSTAPVISGALMTAAAIPAASAAKVETPRSASPRRPVTPPAVIATPAPDSQRPPASLLASFKHTFLGIDTEKPTDVKPTINRNQLGVQVWTFQRTGYYYCADSPYYKTLQPGTTMSQVDALQSGYQPRLEQYCN